MTTKQYNNLYITFFSGFFVTTLFVIAYILPISFSLYKFLPDWLMFVPFVVPMLVFYIYIVWIPYYLLAPRGIIDRLPGRGFYDILLNDVPRTRKNYVFMSGAIIPTIIFLILFIYTRNWTN